MPAKASGTSGGKNTIAKSATNVAQSGRWSRSRRCASTIAPVATTRLSASGALSRMPKIQKDTVKINVHNGDDDDEEKASGVTPHTPCCTMAFAMDIWI